MTINTQSDPGRRKIRFESLDDILADVERLAEAERNGKLERVGNWTFGQSLGHMATWVGYTYDGIPLKIPFLLRLLLRPMKRRMLRTKMRPGLRIPGTTEGTLGTELLSTEEGLSRFKAAIERLRREPPTKPHMFFGQMTHDEWISLQLRHAECHLATLRIKGT
ncbi:DUF1569 domain-containing protein [Humisphaera borealis]|uniref:DUF1569 domain-containing protein n=1 Tax=Humisphaera borealis TaxID=2807512 RepID=A0A7M2WZS5_9BACT|nr:DUF1569 domain-containing protein [Humisphaera borealis]QOV90702.1 DUF1569 domain-containing protein [Humisphaera borealis]